MFVPAEDAVALLGEINARGITRLAVPDGEPGDMSRLTWGASTWAEQGAARDRLQSCFAYDPSGEVDGADTRISSTDPRLEENPRSSLDLIAATEEVRGREGDDEFLPGLAVAADNFRWVDCVRARRNELSTAVRGQLALERDAALERAEGARIETFRRLDVDAALALVASLG